MQTAIDELMAKATSDLQEISAADSKFVAALYGSFPNAAQHAGFEMFDHGWVKRHGREILRSIKRVKDIESLTWKEKTAVSVAVSSAAADLVQLLHLPQSCFTAAFALILIIAHGLSHRKDDTS